MRGSQERSLAAVCCWAVVLIALLPGMILLSAHPRFGAALAVQCAVLAHSGAALARVLTATSVRLMALGFWLFTYVWLGLAPFAMLATDTYPLSFRTGEATAFAASALIELGLIAYSGGVALAARRRSTRPVVLEPLLSRKLTPVPVLLLCGLALVFAIALIPQQGGWAAFFTSRQAVRQTGAASETARAMSIWAVAVPAFWGLLGLLHLPLLKRGDRWLRKVRWMLLPLMLALNVVVNNPISRPRFWAGTVLLTLLFSWRRFDSPRVFRVTAAALAAVVLLVFPYSDYFRYDQRETVHVVPLSEQLTTGMDYDSYQQMQTGVDYVEEKGFSPSSALGVPLFMVPRSAWPDKPQATGAEFADYAGYDFKNLSAPLWIEGFLWAGAPCVVVVFLLLGVASRRMDDIRERLRDSRSTLAVLLVPAFAFYQLILLRGSLIAIVGPLVLVLVVPLLITTRSARSPRVPSPALPPPIPGHVPIPGKGGIRDHSHQPG